MVNDSTGWTYFSTICLYISCGFYFGNNIFGNELHSKLVSEKLTFPWQVKKISSQTESLHTSNKPDIIFLWVMKISLPILKKGKRGGTN